MPERARQGCRVEERPLANWKDKEVPALVETREEKRRYR
jgi:hypothetical protein